MVSQNVFYIYICVYIYAFILTSAFLVVKSKTVLVVFYTPAVQLQCSNSSEHSAFHPQAARLLTFILLVSKATKLSLLCFCL